MDFSDFRPGPNFPKMLEKDISEYKGAAGVRRLAYYKKFVGNLLASVLHLTTTIEGKLVPLFFLLLMNAICCILLAEQDAALWKFVLETNCISPFLKAAPVATKMVEEVISAHTGADSPQERIRILSLLVSYITK